MKSASKTTHPAESSVGWVVLYILKYAKLKKLFYYMLDIMQNLWYGYYILKED